MAVFAQRLKFLREQGQLLQKELADKIGVKRSTLASWETNNRSPEVNTLIHLADFFNVSVDYILGRTDIPGNANNKYITPDDINSSDINKEQLKKYVKYMVALDDADAAEMTTEELQYLIRISKEAIAMGKEKSK